MPLCDKCKEPKDESFLHGRSTYSAKEGWRCPRCERIYAPFMPECAHCNNQLKAKEDYDRQYKEFSNKGTTYDIDED